MRSNRKNLIRSVGLYPPPTIKNISAHSGLTAVPCSDVTPSCRRSCSRLYCSASTNGKKTRVFLTETSKPPGSIPVEPDEGDVIWQAGHTHTHRSLSRDLWPSAAKHCCGTRDQSNKSPRRKLVTWLPLSGCRQRVTGVLPCKTERQFLLT